MSIELTIVSLDFDAKGYPKKLEFSKDTVVLGSGYGSDAVIENEGVEDRHVKFIVDNVNGSPAIRVMDLGSADGTFVGKSLLEPGEERTLEASDRIKIGSFLIRPAFKKAAVEKVAKVVEREVKIETKKIDLTAVTKKSDPLAEYLIESEEEAQKSAMQQTKSDILRPVSLHKKLLSENKIEETKVSVNSNEPNFILKESRTERPREDVRRKRKQKLLLPLKASEPSKKTSQISLVGNLRKEKELKEDKAKEKLIDKKTEAGTSILSGTLIENVNLSFDFKAKKVFQLSGCIKHKGAPVVGAEVSGGSFGSSTTNKKGWYTFEGIPEGTKLKLSAKKEGFIFTFDKDHFAIDSDRKVDAKATKLLTLSGCIQRDGKPVEGVEVDGGSLGKVLTGKDGKYSFDNIPEGTEYSLSASKDGFIFEGA